MLTIILFFGSSPSRLELSAPSFVESQLKVAYKSGRLHIDCPDCRERYGNRSRQIMKDLQVMAVESSKNKEVRTADKYC